MSGVRHKNLQTTEIYLQAIDSRFRETMRLLEGNVISFLSETLSENKNLLTTYSPTSRQKERVQGFEP